MVREIRPAADGDREAIGRVVGLSFNHEWHPERADMAGTLCVFEDGALVATGRAIPFGQWFGGRRVACAGISGVAVPPEQRGRGLGSELMRALLEQQREAGHAISTLYPANVELYRQLGYEFGGLRPELAVPVAHLPDRRPRAVREAGPGQVPTMMEMFSAYAAAHNGPVESTGPRYFTQRSLAHEGEGTHQRTVVVEGDDGLEGYASYFTGPQGPEARFRLTCKHLVATTPQALASLLGYFRHFENAAKVFAWTGPPGLSPLDLCLSTNGFTLEISVLRWMTRLLDVPAALRQRGYASVEAELVLEIEDPMFPANRGPWLISASGGQVEVAPAGAGRARGRRPGARAAGNLPMGSVSIGALSALYTAHASPAELAQAGLLSAGDGAAELLGRLFAGPAPWMPEFF